MEPSLRVVSQLASASPSTTGGTRPDVIYIDATVKENAFVRAIRARLSNIPCEEIEDLRWLRYPTDFLEAKRVWLLTAGPRPLLRTVPSGDATARAVLELAHNTPYDTSYSPLRVTLAGRPIVRIGAAIEAILAEIASRAAKHPRRSVRVQIGARCDALALDDMTQLSATLVPFAGFFPNCTLELRTRTDNVGQLLKLPHNGRTVVTFAVNPRALIAGEERGTPSLVARLAAARRCLNAGYRVGFAIDPIIQCAGWERLYEEMLDELFTHVAPDECETIDLQCLRYPKGLPELALRAFPGTQIFFSEFAPVRGEYRYFRPLRDRMYQWFAAILAHRQVSTKQSLSA
ncbi:MAG: hypothetical protein HY543_01270 [Deltaproteobacteria bacterium]|nr:hypothetical protein [Deltaproteobacteria bacterium]